MLFGQNLFQPERLSLSGRLVDGCGMVKDDELLTTTVTAKSTHFFAIGCPLSGLTLLDGHGIHVLTFYRLLALLGAALYVSSVRSLRIVLSLGEGLAICRSLGPALGLLLGTAREGVPR